MRQTKIFLLFLLSFAILFAGCSSSPTPSPATPKPPEPANSEDFELEEALVIADYLRDVLLSKYDSYAEFIEFDDEGYQKIIFTTNVSVKDFKFIEIDFKEENEDIVFFASEVLYLLEELKPEEPFVVTWMEWGSIPHRGISFIDETDTTRHFMIGMSGEDGSLYLNEFSNE